MGKYNTGHGALRHRGGDSAGLPRRAAWRERNKNAQREKKLIDWRGASSRLCACAQIAPRVDRMPCADTRRVFCDAPI